jgi:hypothetical protein
VALIYCPSIFLERMSTAMKKFTHDFQDTNLKPPEHEAVVPTATPSHSVNNLIICTSQVSPHLLTAATDKIKQLIWALLLSEH